MNVRFLARYRSRVREQPGETPPSARKPRQSRVLAPTRKACRLCALGISVRRRESHRNPAQSLAFRPFWAVCRCLAVSVKLALSALCVLLPVFDGTCRALYLCRGHFYAFGGRYRTLYLVSGTLSAVLRARYLSRGHFSAHFMCFTWQYTAT